MDERLYTELDRQYMAMDKDLVVRTRNIRLVPDFANRRGGKTAYGEWCHVIGLFQSLIAINLTQSQGAHILDVGCGTGLLGIASEPFVQDGGRYTGIDINRSDIDFCKSHYPKNCHFAFIHLDVGNPHYAPAQGARKPWAVPDASQDLVTALSVWTHLRKEDAVFYFREIDRVLKPGVKAIVTFFLLDQTYQDTVDLRNDERGKFNGTATKTWIFDRPCPDSTEWYHPKQIDIPEKAVGVTPQGLSTLIEDTRLTHLSTHLGNWKERPGIFFQDILIFQKAE